MFKPDSNLYVETANSGRISRWEDPEKREGRSQKPGWGATHTKSFTPQCFSYFP